MLPLFNEFYLWLLDPVMNWAMFIRLNSTCLMMTRPFPVTHLKKFCIHQQKGLQALWNQFLMLPNKRIYIFGTGNINWEFQPKFFYYYIDLLNILLYLHLNNTRHLVVNLTKLLILHMLFYPVTILKVCF